MPPLGRAGVGHSAAGHGWQSHKLAAGLVRVGIAVVPVAAALAAGITVAGIWARPRAGAAQAGWWGASLGAAATCSYLGARAARRLLPLAVLLRLSLSFPDRTPSRFAVALRAGALSDLKERARRLTEPGSDVTMAGAAREVILLAVALTSHDRGTRGHSERVRALTDVLAEEMRLSPTDRDRLQWAGLLHDIGKVSVPGAILNKPGPLDDEEWQVMRQHPLEGAKLLGPLAEWLGPWADVIPQHHERYNGTGYPHGLAGDEICLGARIVAVADTFEVMTSARSYKRSLPAEVARQEISADAGDLFDPDVARALLNVSIGRLRWASGPLAWLFAWPLVERIEAAAQALQPAVQGSLTTAAAAAAGTLVAVVAVASGPPANMASAQVPGRTVTVPAAPAVTVSAAVPVDAAPVDAAPPAPSADSAPAVAMSDAPQATPTATPATAAPAPKPVSTPTAPQTEAPQVESAPAPEGPPRAVLGAGTHQLSVQLPISVPAVPLAVTVTAKPPPKLVPELVAAPSGQ